MEQPTDTMQRRLAEIGAGIDRLLARADANDLVSGVRKELGVWREWLDEVRVQSALGAMEGRDRVEEAMEALERLHSKLHSELELVQDVADPTSGLEDAIRRELEGSRQILSGPEAFASDTSST